jgi:hypothetical protein
MVGEAGRRAGSYSATSGPEDRNAFDGAYIAAVDMRGERFDLAAFSESRSDRRRRQTHSAASMHGPGRTASAPGIEERPAIDQGGDG